ncbi:hypothetical protein [Minwuia sp.]|uniref:hypothetical protein n=1 Tax=Minwuia sp. TaxID=2493630 RepID=UPI003A93EE98
MADSDDAPLIDALRQGLETGQARLHVSYRRARKVDGFRAALAAEVGDRAVLIRDHFMKAGLAILLVWFFTSQALDLEAIQVRVFGTPMTWSFLSFALVLLALVMFYRSYIKPIQGGPMHRAALSSPELFIRLWQAGALAIILPSGEDRICQSPRGEWRQYIRRALMF